MLMVSGGYEQFAHFLAANEAFCHAFSGFFQKLFPLLSLFILLGVFYSLLHIPKKPEIFARLQLPDGSVHLLHHFECLLGRTRQADIQLPYATVSRLHAVISSENGRTFWITDLDSKCGTYVNGQEIAGKHPLRFGDTISLGEVTGTFLAVSAKEQVRQRSVVRRFRPIPAWSILVLLTLLQLGLCLQLCINKADKYYPYIVPAFLGLTILMWTYYLVMRFFRITGFELELIAFYLTTVSFSITTSSYPYALPKQLASVVIGIILLLLLSLWMRNLRRVQNIRWAMAAFALGLMLLTLLLGTMRYGATNWIHIGGFSFQPSELAKLCYIFAGASTLDRLFRKRNLGLFLVLTFSIIVCLGIMSDFGTAAIFFITFLVIAFLRSGDFTTLILLSSGAVTAGMMLLLAKPYIWSRFSTWRHAWEHMYDGGYQQVRTMTAIASGGLFGVGAGKGNLTKVAASDTDLVFGMVSEELGLITGLLTIACIIILAIYAISSCKMSRSSFYTIAACSATSMLVFQTALNIFGSVDLLPLTGVTFPFVSNGGSSMLLSWGLLAYLKATDSRPSASLTTYSRKGGRR